MARFLILLLQPPDNAIPVIGLIFRKDLLLTGQPGHARPDGGLFGEGGQFAIREISLQPALRSLASGGLLIHYVGSSPWL